MSDGLPRFGHVTRCAAAVAASFGLYMPAAAAADGDGAAAARKARQAQCEQALAKHEALLLEYYKAPPSEEARYDDPLTKREQAVKEKCAGFDIVYRIRVRGDASQESPTK